MTYYPTLGVSQPALMDILNTISDIVFTIARDDDGMWAVHDGQQAVPPSHRARV